MSTLKVDAIRHNSATSDAITTAADGTCTAKLTSVNGGQLSNRNLIINGAMQVAQRGTSFTTPTNDYNLDRFKYFSNIDTGRVGVTQESITDLTGFTKAVKINCSTAETGVPAKAGSKFATITTSLEGQDLQQLAYGTSGAKQITLSFYVKSNITGTFCLSIYKGDQTNRNVSLGYTINSANTWEKKTLTFPADTGGGGIDNDNGAGLQFYWILARQQGYQGTASTTWGNNTDARFANLCTATIFENTNDHIFITGVQLEVGDTATSFEHRSIGDELARCQRYYYQVGPLQSDVFGQGRTDNDDVNMLVLIHYPVTMRSAPAFLTTTGSAGNYDVRRDTTKGCSAVPTIHTTSSIHLAQIICQSSSHGWGTASPMQLQADGSGNAFLGFQAEL